MLHAVRYKIIMKKFMIATNLIILNKIIKNYELKQITDKLYNIFIPSDISSNFNF